MKLLQILLTLLLWGGGATAAQGFLLTPQNAVGFVYKNLKSLNLRALLPYCRGPEKKKLKQSIRNIKRNSSHYWALKKQSKTMDGYRVTRQEIYEDVAAVTYYWKIRTPVPVKPGSHLTRVVIVKIPYELMLRKIDKKWFLIATRAKKPAGEIGPQDYRRKMEKKYGKKKPGKRTVTF